MELTYYLTIDGLNGGSLEPGHEGAFEIDGFDLDVSALMSAVSGGDAIFSPLTVDLLLGSGLIGLLDRIAEGLPLPLLIRIEGVTATGQTVYDLKLGDVEVTNVHDVRGGDDTALDSLTFDYSQITLTTTPLIGTKLGTPSTFGWDIGIDKALSQLPNPVAAGDASGGGGGGALNLPPDD